MLLIRSNNSRQERAPAAKNVGSGGGDLSARWIHSCLYITQDLLYPHIQPYHIYRGHQARANETVSYFAIVGVDFGGPGGA